MEASFFIKAAQLIIAFGLLVIVHEFGHYLFARIFGIRVEKFYIFFDPWFSLFKYKPKKKPGTEDKASWRDTEYGIGWLPLGGYCKISGMIDESMDTEQMKQPVQPWEFRAKPAWQRLLVMVAGVVFNFILAIVIYAGIAYTWGDAYIPYENATYGMQYCETAHKAGFKDGDIPLYADSEKLNAANFDLLNMLEAKTITVLRNGKDTVSINLPDNMVMAVNNELKDSDNGFGFMTYRFPAVVKEPVKGEAAEKAGLKAGDRITGVDSVPAETWDLFTAELAKKKGQEITLQYIRPDGSKASTTLKTTDSGKIGILLTPITEIYETKVVKYSLLGSVPRGIEIGVDKLTSYIDQMKYVFTKEGAQSLGGFGAIGDMFPDQWNWYQFWVITAFISVALAFMNILPIPALDGGHVIFLIYEMITGKQPSQKVLEYAQMTGLILLVALLLYANGNDIYRFFFK